MKKARLLCPAISIVLFIAISIGAIYLVINLAVEPVWQPYASTYGSPFGEIQVWVAIKERLDGYLVPLSEHDIQRALHVWEVPEELPKERLSALNQRKQEITAFLAKSNVDSTYSILDMQRWNPPCCEFSFPGVTDSYTLAIGVRVKVQLINKDGDPIGIYNFDIFAPPSKYAHWGETVYWRIRDVYPEGNEPLYWRYLAKIHIEPFP